MSAERWWVVRTSALGDVVLATAAVRTLRAACPRAEITVVTRAAHAPLLRWCEDIGRIVTLEEDAAGGGPEGLRRFAASISVADHPKALLDLQGGMRGRVLAAALGVPRHAVTADGAARRLLVRVGRSGFPGRYWPARPVAPAWQKMARAAARAAGAPSTALRPPHLLAPSGARARAAYALGAAAPRVVICAGARAEKRWPADHVAQLARTLSADRAIAVLEDDGPDPPEIHARRDGTGVWHVRASLADAAAVLALADVVVAGDTGLAHVAAALGARVVSLFGPTVPALGFAPAGPGHRILELPLACRPCSVHGTRPCWRGDHACLAQLLPDRVADAVRAQLADLASAAP